MSDTLKRKDENIKQYAIRLYRDKDLLDLTNKDIGDLLNQATGENWDESAYRKKYTIFIEGYDEGYKKGYDDALEGKTHEIVEEIDKKQDELYKQQVKTRDKLREYRKLLRDEARIENLKDLIIESANIISKNNPLELTKNYQEKNYDKLGVIQLSDWHFSEIVDNFLNKFDHNEFDRRMRVLTNTVIKHCKSNGIKALKVINQNDLICGNIHVSSRVQSEEDAIFQIQYVSEALSNVLHEWGKEFDLVEFHSVLDNHSRLNKNKKEHIEKENMARFIPWYLKARLSSVNNVKIMENSIDDNIGCIDIFHEKALFVHGHLDKPRDVIQNLTLMTRIFPIAVFMAHVHHNVESEVHSIDLIVNPSLIGTNDYAKDIRRSSMARQKLTIFENVNGNVERMATFFINF